MESVGQMVLLTWSTGSTFLLLVNDDATCKKKVWKYTTVNIVLVSIYIDAVLQNVKLCRAVVKTIEVNIGVRRPRICWFLFIYDMLYVIFHIHETRTMIDGKYNVSYDCSPNFSIRNRSCAKSTYTMHHNFLRLPKLQYRV